MNIITNQINYGQIKAANFTNRSLKSWLAKNVIQMYATHYKGKSVVAERFIKILKNKIFKYTTSISKKCTLINQIHIKYKLNAYHRTIKVKPVDFNKDFDKAKLFSENFSKNSNLDDSGISLPIFLSRINLKLHNISVTSKMVEKVTMNLVKGIWSWLYSRGGSKEL